MAIAATSLSLGGVALGADGVDGPSVDAGAPLELDPEALDFGDVPVTSSAEESITARNVTGAELPLGDVVLQGDPFANAGDDCPGTLAPGETCMVTVSFTPTRAGAFSGTIRFTAVTDEASIAVMAPLAGVGVSSQPTTTSEPPPTSTTNVPKTTVTGPERSTTTTPGTTTTTTPEPPVSDRARLAQCEQRARHARLDYPPRLALTVGEPVQFDVSARTDDRGPTDTASVPTTVVPVQLRCEVQAQLRGVDIDIDPKEFQPATFLEQPTITWSWDITAIAPGDKVLHLEIRSVAVIDGRPLVGAGRQLYTSRIHVVAQPESLWVKTKRISAAVVDHPLVRGLSSLVLLAAIVAGAWRWLRRQPWSPWPVDDRPREDHHGDTGGS